MSKCALDFDDNDCDNNDVVVVPSRKKRRLSNDTFKYSYRKIPSSISTKVDDYINSMIKKQNNATCSYIPIHAPKMDDTSINVKHEQIPLNKNARMTIKTIPETKPTQQATTTKTTKTAKTAKTTKEPKQEQEFGCNLASMNDNQLCSNKNTRIQTQQQHIFGHLWCWIEYQCGKRERLRGKKESEQPEKYICNIECFMCNEKYVSSKIIQHLRWEYHKQRELFQQLSDKQLQLINTTSNSSNSNSNSNDTNTDKEDIKQDNDNNSNTNNNTNKNKNENNNNSNSDSNSNSNDNNNSSNSNSNNSENSDINDKKTENNNANNENKNDNFFNEIEECDTSMETIINIVKGMINFISDSMKLIQKIEIEKNENQEKGSLPKAKPSPKLHRRVSSLLKRKHNKVIDSLDGTLNSENSDDREDSKDKETSDSNNDKDNNSNNSNDSDGSVDEDSFDDYEEARKITLSQYLTDEAIKKSWLYLFKIFAQSLKILNRCKCMCDDNCPDAVIPQLKNDLMTKYNEIEMNNCSYIIQYLQRLNNIDENSRLTQKLQNIGHNDENLDLRFHELQKQLIDNKVNLSIDEKPLLPEKTIFKESIRQKNINFKKSIKRAFKESDQRIIEVVERALNMDEDDTIIDFSSILSDFVRKRHIPESQKHITLIGVNDDEKERDERLVSISNCYCNEKDKNADGVCRVLRAIYPRNGIKHHVSIKFISLFEYIVNGNNTIHYKQKKRYLKNEILIHFMTFCNQVCQFNNFDTTFSNKIVPILYGIQFINEYLCIFSEYLPYSSMDYFRIGWMHFSPSRTVVKYFIPLMKTVDDFHCGGNMHRDLKLENVMVILRHRYHDLNHQQNDQGKFEKKNTNVDENTLQVKPVLIDFEVSVPKGAHADTQTGTEYFRAPEIAMQNGRATIKSDYYSVGKMMQCLLETYLTDQKHLPLQTQCKMFVSLLCKNDPNQRDWHAAKELLNQMI